NPTELTTVGLEGRRDFVVTTQDDASINFQTSMEVTVDHELWRNLIVGANFGYVRDDFEDISRTDNIYRAGAGATYLLNRNWSIEGGYRFGYRDSDADDEDFTRNRLTIGLTARL
ncbi:MAG: outer membrane beta-barrel protein, partial [Nitrospirota bacterium]|nr:outer membrane beta-barrel protein [Nitrospirota bacterium]